MRTQGRAAQAWHWRWRDRLPFLLLLVAFVFTTPGLGPETRSAPESGWLILLAAAFLGLPIASLAASWRWPAVAARLGVAAGMVIIAIIALDFAGVLVGPPPAGMVVLDACIAGIAAAISLQSRFVLRRSLRNTSSA